VSDLLPQGWMAPSIAYAISAVGSFLGLAFAARARRTTGFFRWQWLALAALSLGGMAVWAMHFVAMLGYTVTGSPLRYDVPLTVISGVIPILVIGIALHLILRRPTTVRILTSGFLVGGGVITMHHTGVAAMNTHGSTHHDPVHVALSCVIAVVAATVALWCARNLHGFGTIALASAVMAAAVTAMHYTSMAGVHVTSPGFTPVGPPDGARAQDLLLPVITGLFVFLLTCSLFLLLGGEDETGRRDYGRPSHRAPEHTVQVGDTSYRPRHQAPQTPRSGPPPRPRDDVWSPKR
jgi:NO-binding membrane sensor protein with MHYT domain